jgi:hypothetical protein
MTIAPTDGLGQPAGRNRDQSGRRRLSELKASIITGSGRRFSVEVAMLVIVGSRDELAAWGKPTWWQRLVARLRAYRLDCALAAGASPDATTLLALRAQLLVRESNRRRMAHYLRIVLAEADAPVSVFRAQRIVPTRRDAVRAAAADVGALIQRLSMPGPLPARGIAQVRVLLTNGAGPLYNSGAKDDLGDLVRAAVEGLDPLANW